MQNRRFTLEPINSHHKDELLFNLIAKIRISEQKSKCFLFFRMKVYSRQSLKDKKLLLMRMTFTLSAD